MLQVKKEYPCVVVSMPLAIHLPSSECLLISGGLLNTAEYCIGGGINPGGGGRIPIGGGIPK